MPKRIVSGWHLALAESDARRRITVAILFVCAAAASPFCLAQQEKTITPPNQTAPAPTPVPSPTPVPAPNPAPAPVPSPAPIAKPTKPLPDLVISIRRRHSNGTDTAVAQAKVRITGSDMEGEETDDNGIVRLPMPSERPFGLQVMVASEPTCVVDKVSASASKPEVTVKIEAKDNRCKATVQGQ